MAVARGIALAHKDAKLPAGYADAMASDELDIEDIEFQVNADRKMDAVISKLVG